MLAKEGHSVSALMAMVEVARILHGAGAVKEVAASE
jgi:hypothetical protein